MQKDAAAAVAGFAEYVDFPEWGIRRLKAKLDTGAHTSALHVEEIRRLKGGKVRFRVVVDPAAPGSGGQVVARVVRRSRIRSSNGQSEERLVVATALEMGGQRWPVEVSLTERGGMRYRLLLGRKALARHFLVDPARRYLVSKSRKRKRAEPAAPGARARPRRMKTADAPAARTGEKARRES